MFDHLDQVLNVDFIRYGSAQNEKTPRTGPFRNLRALLLAHRVTFQIAEKFTIRGNNQS